MKPLKCSQNSRLLIGAITPHLADIGGIFVALFSNRINQTIRLFLTYEILENRATKSVRICEWISGMIGSLDADNTYVGESVDYPIDTFVVNFGGGM